MYAALSEGLGWWGDGATAIGRSYSALLEVSSSQSPWAVRIAPEMLSDSQSIPRGRFSVGSMTCNSRMPWCPKSRPTCFGAQQAGLGGVLGTSAETIGRVS